jgi:hypothetical protein
LIRGLTFEFLPEFPEKSECPPTAGILFLHDSCWASVAMAESAVLFCREEHCWVRRKPVSAGKKDIVICFDLLT